MGDTPTVAHASDAFGWRHFEACLVDMQHDARWRSKAFGLVDDRIPEAALVARSSGGWAGLDVVARHDLSALDLVPGPVSLLGGLARGLGGGFVRSGRTPFNGDRALASLAADARDWAPADAPCVALWLPEHQLGAFLMGWNERARVVPADVWTWIDLRGHDDLDDFVASLDRKERHVWRRDVRVGSQIGFRTECVDLTESGLEEALPLLAAVNENNGDATPAALLRFRIRRWAAGTGHYVIFRTVDAQGVLVSVVTAQVGSDYLDLCDVGIVKSESRRRDIYANAVFVSPAEFALENGIPSVYLGAGHSTPKILHGAKTWKLWNVVDDDR